MLITNATLVTWNAEHPILNDHALYIENGVIQAVGPTEVLIPHYRDAERLDAEGQMVLPGNICAHTHFYGAYARGLGMPGAPPQNFPQILEKLWWPLDKALDHESIRASALLFLVDAVKRGTTTLIDHHASPNAIDGSLDVIAQEVERAGLRAVLCYEVSDRDGKEKAEAGIAENVRFIKNHLAHPRIRGTFGLHASITLSDQTLQACTAANPGEGFHIHVAEHEADEEDSVRHYNKRVVERLRDLGILGDKSIVAHCVHIDQTELNILYGTRTWITHQPRSNMNNAVGVLPHLEQMLKMEMRLCLGNDGFLGSMWEEWRMAYFLHKVASRNPQAAGGWDIVRIAVENNAALAGRFFTGKRFGIIAEGAQADLIFVNYQSFTPVTSGNIPWHILFGFEPDMVTLTMVDGHILMQNRELITLQEDEILAEARALAPRVWERYHQFATR
ncbi:MAG: putative aminohydrolase SsnA [bacterium]|nr:putative aminohydrolase SsnA [bacterium]